MDDSRLRKNEKQEKGDKKKKSVINKPWVLKVSVITFCISVAMGIISSYIDRLNIYLAFAILLVFISIGVMFDFIGLAVATADEKSFHSMAARRIPAGKKAVSLIKNAEKVSSFCNDVIGDICGVISGATGAVIAVRLFTTSSSTLHFVINLLLTAVISTLTIGSKAALKGIGIRYSNDVVRIVAGILCFFDFTSKRK